MLPHHARIDGASFAFAKVLQITTLEKCRSRNNIRQQQKSLSSFDKSYGLFLRLPADI